MVLPNVTGVKEFLGFRVFLKDDVYYDLGVFDYVQKSAI